MQEQQAPPTSIGLPRPTFPPPASDAVARKAKGVAGCLRRALGVALLLMACPVAYGADALAAAQSPIVVHATRDGNRVVVDISMEVDATAAQTWSVMTDYDRMAEFITSLDQSRILSRDGNRLTVAQKGTASWGLIRFPFENVRAIELGPGYSVRSRMISGDMVSSDFVTRIIDHGLTSQLINHGEFVPKMWIPPLIGVPIIEAAARKQFEQFRDEVLRRKLKSADVRGR